MATTSLQVPQENYTILRIKRKRNEEPLDALGWYTFSACRSSLNVYRQLSSRAVRGPGAV